MLDLIQKGEVPMVIHLLYTQVLNNQDPDDRTLGIDLGMQWLQRADYTVVYKDLGISSGMRYGIKRAIDKGNPIVY